MKKLLVISAAGAMSVSLAMPQTAAARPVTPTMFGMHVAGVAGARPSINVPAVRLWDAGVRWDQIQPKKGQYRWAALDAAVANARAAGAKEILYVLGSTPRWAAANRKSPGLYGKGTTSLPKKTAYYTKYAKSVAQRYKGLITSYQVWNEANTRSFYNGGTYNGWVKLAALTKAADKAIGSVDKNAAIVAASSTVIPTAKFQTESFFFRYLRDLKRQKVNVDAISVHLYPVDAAKGPDARVASIKAVRKVMKRTGMAKKPLWDTEVNYGDRRSGRPQVVPRPAVAAAYVARTYLDSAQFNIARTFWYGWDIDVLGISLTRGGVPTRAGRAYLTMSQWLSGAEWQGCKKQGPGTTCTVTGAKAATIVYGSGTITTPAGVRQVCKINGKCTAAGTTVRLKAAPQRLVS